jgi:hypothetical protein
MPLDANLQAAMPAEVVALARLAQSQDFAPPPRLRPDLEAKGWIGRNETGSYLLTSEGRSLLEQFE